MFTALQNTPISVDLLTQARTTGWSVDGAIASHDSCNSGSIPLNNYPVIAGTPYQVSYIVPSISSGYVQVQAPGFTGVNRTTAGLYVETVTPTSNGFISFFSNGTCTLSSFNIKAISTSPGITIVYSAINKKWSDYRNFYPDYGWSLYTRTITAHDGALYNHNNGGGSTNNFYGTQYQSSIKFVEAKNPSIIKQFEALNYQANQLLITTQGGVQTSLGQISTLIDTDFLETALSSGGMTVNVYDKDGVYSASFLQDEGDDVVNGNQLNGNYAIIELITYDGSTPLTLFSVAVRTAKIPIGVR